MPVAMYVGCLAALVIATPASAQQDPDSTVSQESLLAQITELDARYFGAHNSCDLEALRALLAPDMEAYHDVGGSLNGREAFMAVMQQFCSHPERTRRELIPGTLEAHRLADVGGLHMAHHRFYGVESGEDRGGGKMIMLWRRHGDEWQVFRSISYDHTPPTR